MAPAWWPNYALDGEVALVVYLPPGCGEQSVADALAVLPLRVVMPLLVAMECACRSLTEKAG